ncbi:hypothetical protein cypCar_00029941 [Cyprinus carpio]|nr:hypothetical protein cypCar_00029941 [Cyprinus carpio]
MAEHLWSITNCRNHKMSSKENESQSTEAGEKQSKSQVRRSSFNEDTPNFLASDSDRPAEIHSDDSKRDAHRQEDTSSKVYFSLHSSHIKCCTSNVV